MKIGMIGAGNVALAVARYALQTGHEVILSSRRGGEELSQAVVALGHGAASASVAEAASANMVLLAVPWSNIPAALAGVPAWDSRILIDATNPYARSTPELALADLGGRGASEIVADLAPGARLVKAFNSIRMVNFAAGPRRDDARRVVFVSGDDAVAKGTVKDLIASFGFAVIDLGSLKEGGRMQQAGGPLAGPDLLVG